MNETHAHEPRRCDWLVHGVPRWVTEAYAECDDFEWYPDSPSDLVSECGAPVTELDNGWECTAGHSHFVDAEYYDDDELAGLAQRRLPLAPNARRMDGSPVA